MDTYIVNVSSGLASAEALERTIARGAGAIVPIFADVRGHSTNVHAGEDADNYRFLDDIERYFGIAVIRIVEGRDIWQAMFDARAITLPVGKTRVARCSIDLKREPIDRWIADRYTPETTVQVTGLDWSEPHRIADFEAAKAPYRCWFPLAEPPYLDKCHLADKWTTRGINPPRLYDQGFTHANCGGFCVKAGQAHFALLYRVNKLRYLYHAEKEAQFQREINPKITILRDRRGGVSTPITLYEFAARLDRGEGYDRDEWGGVRLLCPRPAGAHGRSDFANRCSSLVRPQKATTA